MVELDTRDSPERLQNKWKKVQQKQSNNKQQSLIQDKLKELNLKL